MLPTTGDSLSDHAKNSTPQIELFGGVFALLLVLFLLINTFLGTQVEERLGEISEEGVYKIGWETKGSGYTVIVFPNEVSIVQNGATVGVDELCDPRSPFLRYVHEVYAQPKTQIIFILLENSVRTMAKARSCLRTLFPARPLSIGWIIADNELLKSVSLDDIQPYIGAVLKARR